MSQVYFALSSEENFLEVNGSTRKFSYCQFYLGIIETICVIVMTFWYVFGTDLTFSNFLNFILHLGLITTPHVFYVHMTYVYSFSHVSFFT